MVTDRRDSKRESKGTPQDKQQEFSQQSTLKEAIRPAATRALLREMQGRRVCVIRAAAAVAYVLSSFLYVTGLQCVPHLFVRVLQFQLGGVIQHNERPGCRPHGLCSLLLRHLPGDTTHSTPQVLSTRHRTTTGAEQNTQSNHSRIRALGWKVVVCQPFQWLVQWALA